MWPSSGLKLASPEPEPRLRISGAIPLFRLYAFVKWRGQLHLVYLIWEGCKLHENLMLDTVHVYCISYKVNASGLIPFALISVFWNTFWLVQCRHTERNCVTYVCVCVWGGGKREWEMEFTPHCHFGDNLVGVMHCWCYHTLLLEEWKKTFRVEWLMV
jgi:hypothetical protein